MFGTGLYRSTFGRGDISLDVVYLDLVVKSLLLKIFDLGTSTDHHPGTKVMLVCGGELDPFNYDGKMSKSREAFEKYPFMKCFWYPGNVTTTFYPYYLWRVYIYQLIPSLLIDLILKSLGKPPVAMALQRRAHTGNMELKHFLANSFQSDGITELKRFNEVSTSSDFKGSFGDFNISEYAALLSSSHGDDRGPRSMLCHSYVGD